MPRRKVDELFAYLQSTSPVADLIANPVPVTIIWGLMPTKRRQCRGPGERLRR
jgi:hypothetical protein